MTPDLAAYLALAFSLPACGVSLYLLWARSHERLAPPSYEDPDDLGRLQRELRRTRRALRE